MNTTTTTPFAAAVAIGTVAAILAYAAPAAADTGYTGDAGCPAVAGVFLPGTWETNPKADPTRPVGMLAPVATGLAARFGARFTARFPGYSASAWDRGLSYGDSEATGVATVRRELTEFGHRCPATKYVLSGYSQGADAVGDVAASIGCGADPVEPDRVIAVALVADPRQGTAGGKLVGPRVDGQGIEGTRPGGFCRLSAVTAELCDPRDRYCTTNSASNPILAGLGRILTGHSAPPGSAGNATDGGEASPAGTTTDSVAALSRSLLSDFTGADLPRLAANVNTVVTQVLSGHVDPAAVSAAAETVRATLRPLSDLVGWASSQPAAVIGLTGAAAGSPRQAAGRVLSAAQHSDLAAASRAAGTLSHAATGEGAATAARTLQTATAPLTSTPADALSLAASVLSVLKPSQVFDEVVNVAGQTLSFATHVPAILDQVHQIIGVIGDPHVDLAGKVRGLHRRFQALNELCAPLVKMAAGVDLHMVARLLNLIPAPDDVAQIAATVVDLVGNLDIVDVALRVGRLQDQLWAIAEAITGGDNPADIGGKFLGLAPTVLGFATDAVNALTGQPKTPPTALDSPSPGTSPSSAGVGGAEVAGLSEQLVDTAASDGAGSLRQLVSDGLSAISFFASGAHQGYDHFVVDRSGRTAISWVLDWFADRIGQVGAVS